MRLGAVFSLLLFSFVFVYGDSNAKHYIVYMGEHSHPNSDAVISANHEMLASIMGSIDGAKQATVYHYSKSFRGFSAMLTPEQARLLAESEEVISVFESRTNIVHTTHSWDFLGVGSRKEFQTLPYSKSDVIIASIDSGVWPESKSFKDDGLGPVPTRFKGECVTGDNFTLANCNRKIIGARFYYKAFEAEIGPLESMGGMFFRSARDSDGHGTHTASTAAGSIVSNVSLLGMAKGTARGGAPGARLAIYKVCWFNKCRDADILSAFDDAISDGVDIISISVGPNTPPQPSFFIHSISIGAFHAFKKGILTSASAGNFGRPGTAVNISPWILTVAASSLDRKFESDVTLGNSKVLKGQSLNPLKLDGFYSIIPASVAAAPGVPSLNASFCKNNTLDPKLIMGKIVVCTIDNILETRIHKSIVVKEAGGVGMILIDTVAVDVGFQFVIPSTLLGLQEAKELQAYLASEKNPTATIAPTETVFNTKPAPEMAVFSSMGPNIITPDIIKPDITAPGLNILAAWSPVATEDTQRSVDYNIISGTSMACPHVSATAAIIKSYHPYWSPAAIKSALMTTSIVLDNTGNTILRDPTGSSTTPFDYGSGHIDPVAALDPGLVYDHDADDIVDFLCSSIGATPSQLQKLTGEPTTCKSPPILFYNFNYPSISISNLNGSVSVYRTVTYYGSGCSVYTASVESPAGVNVAVAPYKLKFEKVGEKLTYRLDFKPLKDSNGSFVFGAVTWSDDKHVVRSPIALNVTSV